MHAHARACSLTLASTPAAGFYLGFSDSDVPATVRSWNVRPLALSRTSRHLDHSTMGSFWQALEMYMEMKKPYLLPSTRQQEQQREREEEERRRRMIGAT